MGKFEKLTQLKFPLLQACGSNISLEDYRSYIQQNLSAKKLESEEDINRVTFDYFEQIDKAFTTDWKTSTEQFIEQIQSLAGLPPNIQFETATITAPDFFQSLHAINQTLSQYTTFLLKYTPLNDDLQGYFLIARNHEPLAIETRFIDYQANDY